MELFDALKNWGYRLEAGGAQPDGIPEYLVAIYRYDFIGIANTDVLNDHPEAVSRLQDHLTDRCYYTGLVDGIIDDGYSRTVYALQRYLGDMGYYGGEYDGKLDPGDSLTVRAYRAWAGLPKSGHVDGEMIDHMRSL